MSTVKQLLNSLLWDIYGKQQVDTFGGHFKQKRYKNTRNTMSIMATNILGFGRDGSKSLDKLTILKLIDICAILKVEIRLMGYILERVLIYRDRNLRHQEILCEFVDAILHLEYHDAHPKMRFSLSPPPPKATSSAATSPTMQSNSHSHRATEQKYNSSSGKSGDEEHTESADDAASDYKQWLHAMKLVARLPGGMPPEFRRKLWLSLADKYLKSKNVDWVKEEEKCFCEKWREDDEELGIQIVKDLHRTGSNLCTGPAGSINQAKLKRILLGYARYNPEVGYCQGFNMLGALILQVMDKEEAESMKVMVYLVEGVLPPGYFCGSMGGLQADMGVFRELMTSKLPRLAKHLQKLQGPIENAYEPPLTNVFTMQWFLTMFCTCLPMTCVLRVWDLVLIEGSDVLLRTALVLWSLLEERILRARTADDFYCKMGSFSSELLNGHLIDSNGLIEKVVQLGPIPDIQRLRDKHLYNIAPLRHKQGLQLYFDDEEPESDEESRLAVATVWGIPWGRRGSSGQTTTINKPQSENKDRIALDISLLKKQYDRLRERQKQAQIILTTACSTAARQGSTTTTTSSTGNINPTLPVNQLLMGRSAIITNKGRRIGPPPGAIPPARKPSLPAVLQTKPPEKQLRRGETLHWRDTDISKRRRDSLTWKEIKADRVTLASANSSEELQPRKLRTRLGKSDSSSYSDESEDDEGGKSSTDTSLCDEDDPASGGSKAHGLSSAENSPRKKSKTSRKQKELSTKLKATAAESTLSGKAQRRPKSWAPTSDEIPFMLMTSDSPVHSGDEKIVKRSLYENLMKEEEDSATESDRVAYKFANDLYWSGTKFSPIAGDLATASLSPLHVQTDVLELPAITSTSQLSPLPDIARYLNDSAISPLPTPKPLFLDSTNSLGSGDGEGGTKLFDVSDDGVTNEYFERVNSVERPNKLELFYSLSEEDSIRNAYENNEVQITKPIDENDVEKKEPFAELVETTDVEEHKVRKVSGEFDEDVSDERHMKLLDDYSEKSSVACIAEATCEVSFSLSKQKDNNEHPKFSPSDKIKEELMCDITKISFDSYKDTQKILHRKHSFNEASKKRRDPRRLTITRWSTVETEAIEYKPDICESDHKRYNDSQEHTLVTSTDIPSTADLEERFNRLEKNMSVKHLSNESVKSNAQGIINHNSHKDEHSPDKGKNIGEIASTKEVESRITALEKNHLDDRGCSSGNEKDQYKTQFNSIKLKDLSQTEDISETNVSKIPSTADLESRFNALEKQMVTSKPTDCKMTMDLNNVIENAEKHISPATDLFVQSSEVLNSIVSDSGSSKSNHLQASDFFTREENSLEEKNISTISIPSEKDKESILISLERQVSSTESSIPKNSIPPNSKTTDQKNSDKNGTEKAKDLQGNTKLSDKKVDASTKEPEDDYDAKSVHNSKPRLSKIPSTAELEDRFNALERKMSISKSNTKSAKKEPPDQGCTTEGDRLGHSTEVKLVNKSKPSDLIDNPKESDKTNTDNKKPPSTEELEKRFDKLEKESGTSQNVHTKTGPQAELTSKAEHDEATSRKSQKSPPSTKTAGDTKQLKSMQSFNDKCKSINEKLDEEKANKEQIQSDKPITCEESSEDNKFLAEAKKIKTMQSFRTQTKATGEEERQAETVEEINSKKQHEDDKFLAEAKKIKAMQSFHTQHKTTNDPDQQIKADTDKKSKEDTSAGETLDKRRASEPPTTEDLENRYEALKRRMSSKAAVENSENKKKPLVKSETVEEALERIEKDVLDEGIENKKEKEENGSSNVENISSKNLTSQDSTNLDTRHVSEPPTTEELEKRYEKLTCQSSIKTETLVETGNQLEGNRKTESPVKVKQTDIPVPPPMQSKDSYSDNDITRFGGKRQRQALVEELQSKMKPNDENLKPSHVNPNQRRIPNQQRPTKVDETSEAHATTAAKLKLRKKDEPWQSCKMVRRFSDIPSRADLENRVEFLEQQLSSKLIKQRSASDSEVASRKHFVGEGPSVSSSRRYDSDLENRVNALEKQLSENSLKLVEAMRKHNKREKEEENVSPETVNAEFLDSEETGKELVRYTHYKEIEENESSKPINISINIKMHLNKETERKEKKTMNLPTTEELEKRLDLLEQRVSNSEIATNVQQDPIDHKKESQSDILDNAATSKTYPMESKTPLVAQKEPNLNKKEIAQEKNNFEDNIQKNLVEKAPEQLPCTEKTSGEKPQTEKVLDGSASPENKKIESIPLNQQSPLAEAHPTAISDEQNKLEETRLHEIGQSNPNNTTDDYKEVAPIEPSTNQVSNDANSSESKENIVINSSEIGSIDANSKTMVLLLNNEPKACKVRRLTRANTEELEDLFQALEKQLSARNLVKSEDGKLKRADSNNEPNPKSDTVESKAISELAKEIQEFAKEDKEKSVNDESYDWGSDPVKHHLKRKTAYLPSTKELEARFRSLERQIKLLEDVENIDVEQRLSEIERKIKLQYSLSHEKDLSKYLELCEGKLPDDEPRPATPSTKDEPSKSPHTSPGRGKPRSPYTSPSRVKEKTPYTSPIRAKQRSPFTSPSPPPPPRSKQRSPYVSPARQRQQENSYDGIPCLDDLEYRYRVLDLVRSKSKENLSQKSKAKKAIHPLEMLLDSSPDDSVIPSTGELEHRIRVLEDKSITPSPPRKLVARSPTIDDIKRQKLFQDHRAKTPIHDLEALVVSPTRKDLPTAEELEARMRALEEDQKFDFKMQKNYREFNQKLKNVITPSLSFEEFKTAKSREQSPKRSTTPKSVLRDHEGDYQHGETSYRSTSPRTIRFRDEEQRPKSYVEHHRDIGKMVGNSNGVLKIIEENSKMLHRILKNTLAGSNSSINDLTTSEGLDVIASKLMRETSPLRRTGTHTGVPLRTGENINDRLNSIKDTIKSIDTLCEEKPYRKERCQRYIDSLFSDSVYFTSPSKKSSLDDLTFKRRSGEYGPSIRISDHSQRPSDQYLGRSIGSAESLRSTSPLRAASPLHHRSTRDLHRDISPRRRRVDEEREENESRVRRVNLLPNYLLNDSSEISRSSLTKFYKVDNEIDTYKFEDKARSSSRSVSRSPLRSPYGSRETIPTASYTINNAPTKSSNRLDFDRPVSPYRQTSHNLLGGNYDTLKRSNTPVYNPGKLEIRHTTVTSTFYDRFLTEKQIEKSTSRPPSRSPVVSPSVVSKSYLDIPMASSLTHSKPSEQISTTPVMSRSSIGITDYVPICSGSTTLFGYSDSFSITTTANTTTCISSTLYRAAITPTGNSSAFSNSFLIRSPSVTNHNDCTEPRIRSCDNILMQLKSSTATLGAGTTTDLIIPASIAVTSYTSTTATAIINNYTKFLNQISSASHRSSWTTTTASNTANTAFPLTTAGTNSSALPLSYQPSSYVSEIGIQSGTILNNNTSSDFINFPKS